jgi:hypothetical protein
VNRERVEPLSLPACKYEGQHTVHRLFTSKSFNHEKLRLLKMGTTLLCESFSSDLPPNSSFFYSAVYQEKSKSVNELERQGDCDFAGFFSMIFYDMTIVHSDTISITTKGFCDTIDITEKVAQIAEASAPSAESRS